MSVDGKHAGMGGWITCTVGDFTLQAEWEVEPGQILVLFGPSGAGKTTTLKAIAGLICPDAGDIRLSQGIVFNGETGIWVPPYQRQVGYVTQEHNLFPHLRVGHNIAYGLSNRRSGSAKERVQQLLELFQLNGLEDRYPWELSGGQQKRVALARALAPRPEALLLDEPFASLDAELRRSLRNELASILRRDKLPAILVTHDREEALAMGDMVQVIEKGRTLTRGRPLEVLGQPDQGRVARLVGVENILPMKVESRHPQDGTMTCCAQAGDSPGVIVEVPLAEFEVGESLTVGIRASDVILAQGKLDRSSARNQLPGTVTGVEMRPPGYQVNLDCSGTPLICHITGSSLAEMQVEVGQPLWAVFKASSCFLLKEN